MPSKQPSTTTQIQKIELPEWVEKASEDNYNLAKELGTAEFDPYKGERVAGTSAGTKAAYDYFNKNVGSTTAGYNNAQGIFNSINKDASALRPTTIGADQIASQNTSAGTTKAGTTTSQNVISNDVVAKMLGDMDLSKYMNPYISNVEDKALDALDRSRQQSVMSNASAAAGAKAFGGSRHGIVDAVTNAESAREAGMLSANLRADAFNNATNLATSDINRLFEADVGNANRRLTADTSNADRRLASDQANVNRILASDQANVDRRLASDTNNANRNLTAQQSNQSANLSASQANAQNILNTFLAQTGARSDAAQGIMSALQGGQAAKMQDFAGLMQMGQQQQLQSQREIDAAREKHDEKRNYDIENLNLRLSALGMSPYGKTESTTKQTQGGSSGTDWGQLGLGAFSLLLGLSEDDTKTDKEKVGKVPGTDLDLWAYRYKKDPKTYPKVVGVMASDVEKKMPEAVLRSGGKRVINYGAIGEAMARG